MTSKYICPNCGFRNSLQTAKNESKRACRQCGAQVGSSKVVLESILRLSMLKGQ